MQHPSALRAAWLTAVSPPTTTSWSRSLGFWIIGFVDTNESSDELDTPDDATHTDEFTRTFGARFDHLMNTIPDPSGASWTNAHFAELLGERGIPTSRNYVAQLRMGHRVNPSAKLVGAIVALMEVESKYFYSDTYAAALDRDLALLVAVRNAGMEKINLRASGLSPAGLREVENMIEMVRRLEGLSERPDNWADDVSSSVVE